MDLVLRTFAIYIGLLILFRLMGRRSLSQLSSFDLILFLIISEAVQNALVDDDKSVVMGLVIVLTFLMLELGMSLLKRRFGFLDRLAEGSPVLLIDRGAVLDDHLRKSRVTRGEILQSARETQGLESLEDIKYALLETSGNISVIPRADGMKERLERMEAALARLAAGQDGKGG